MHPSWSADGSKLVFQSDRSGIWQIYLLDLATRSISLISDGTRNDQDPTFSPTGDRISFRSHLRSTDTDVIYLMRADGSNPTPISNRNGNASHAAWSNDGTLIAYQSDLDGDLDIYVYELSADYTRQLTDNTVADYAPMWLCDQPTLIFNSDVTGDPNLFQVSALPINAPPVRIEQQARQLTFDPADDLYASNGAIPI